MNLKFYLILINIIFGPLLLFTYYKGVYSGIDGTQLWGGMPHFLRPMSGISMIVSAIGYFFFTYYLLTKVNLDYQFFNRFNFWWIILLYSLVLIPSCFWINLTIEYMNSGMSNSMLWIMICLVLYTVGIASLLLLITLIKIPTEKLDFLYISSIVGCTFFTIHTLLFDGLLWTYFFNK